MGGAVSELRHDIHAHVVIAQHYPRFLEPALVVVQFFLRTAETGEGADPTRPIDEIPMDVVITDKRVFEEASTEIELLVENTNVMRTLLNAIETHQSLELAPDLDPLKRWYDPPWRKDKPMPKFLDIVADEVARFQIAVLRTSIRCLRLMMYCKDARQQLEDLRGPEILNQAVLAHALDDFVRNDVKAIFSAVYGGENAVRRIAIGNVAIVVEMMRENLESAVVQLAGAQRLCRLLAAANALLYTPLAPATTATVAPLFQDIDTFCAVALVTSSLRRFDVDWYLSLHVHVCRFISFVAVEGASVLRNNTSTISTATDLYARLCYLTAEHNAKIIGQEGGVESAVALLLKARAMQREKKQRERDAAAREKQRLASAQSDWNTILESNSNKNDTQAPPPAPTDLATGTVTSVASLAVVDFTPTEVAQQAMWALDLLATLDYNVSQMKLHKLKYVLEEIRLDPDSRELGDALIVTRRLRLIRWDQVGLPPSGAKAKR